MAVNSLALTSLENAKNYLGLSDGDLQINGLTVYQSGLASESAATVEVTDTTIVLIVTTGVNAGTSTLTFTDATDDTLGELVTRINALGKGWIANLSAASSIDSGGLVIVAAADALLVANVQALDVVDNYLIEKTIDRATDVIETYCNRKFKSASYTGRLYTGNGGGYLALRNYPITAVSRVSTSVVDAISVSNSSTAARATVQTTSSSVVLAVVGGTNDGTNTPDYATYSTVADMVTQINATGSGWTATEMNSTGIWPITELLVLPAQMCLTNNASLTVSDDPISGYTFLADEGMLYCSAGWPTGTNSISVDYTAGYATIPDDLEHVCLEIAAYLYGISKGDPSVQSESIGDYSYESTRHVWAKIGQGTGAVEDIWNELTAMAKATLEKYRRTLI